MGISRITFAGLPAAMDHGGTSFDTTDPAATTAPSPTSTPFKMMTRRPSQALLPILTASQAHATNPYGHSPYTSREHHSCAVANRWMGIVVNNVATHEINTSSPISIFVADAIKEPPIKVFLPMLMQAPSRSATTLPSTMLPSPISKRVPRETRIP